MTKNNDQLNLCKVELTCRLISYVEIIVIDIQDDS